MIEYVNISCLTENHLQNIKRAIAYIHKHNICTQICIHAYIYTRVCEYVYVRMYV